MNVCVVLGEKQISDDEIHKRDIGWLTESDGTYGIYKLHHYLEQLSTFWHKTVVVYNCERADPTGAAYRNVLRNSKYA